MVLRRPRDEMIVGFVGLELDWVEFLEGKVEGFEIGLMVEWF